MQNVAYIQTTEQNDKLSFTLEYKGKVFTVEGDVVGNTYLGVLKHFGINVGTEYKVGCNMYSAQFTW